MCYKCNFHMVTKSLYIDIMKFDFLSISHLSLTSLAQSFSQSLSLGRLLPRFILLFLHYVYNIMVTSMILMMINVQIWNMKMGSLCSKISDLCNWQCLFPCQTNQTTLRLSTHVANDWWGFYCDYVFLSLTHSLTHSDVHPAAKLSPMI